MADTTAALLAGADDAREVWRRLGRSGLLDEVWPADASPARPNLPALAGLITGLDPSLPLDLSLTALVQVALALPLLQAMSADGAAPAAGELLHEARQGRCLVAVAATDTDVSGTALPGTTTTVESRGDRTVLHGRKAWITNAEHADHLVVLARHREARHFTSLCWALVPRTRAGVTVYPVGADLYPAAGLARVELDEVHLEPHEVVRRGRALADFVAAVSWERLAGALWANALCRRVLDGTFTHLRTRAAGTGVLWENPVVQDRFTSRVIAWRQLDALCRGAVAGYEEIATGMLLKAVAAETLDATLSECISLQGAQALADDGLVRLRSQASMFGIAGGATGVLRLGLAPFVPALLRVGP